MATQSTRTRKAAAKRNPAKAQPKAEKAPKQPVECGCGCGALVSRRFAPGHDAKLKSRLANEFATGSNGALAQAEELGWGDLVRVQANRIQSKLEAQIRRDQAKAERAEAKANKPARARKAAAKAAEPTSDEPVSTPGFHPVRVKIGRITYDANLEAESTNEVTVSYLTRSGNRTVTTVKRSQIVG